MSHFILRRFLDYSENLLKKCFGFVCLLQPRGRGGRERRRKEGRKGEAQFLPWRCSPGPLGLLLPGDQRGLWIERVCGPPVPFMSSLPPSRSSGTNPPICGRLSVDRRCESGWAQLFGALAVPALMYLPRQKWRKKEIYDGTVRVDPRGCMAMNILVHPRRT